MCFLVALSAVFSALLAPGCGSRENGGSAGATRTPIKHLIVVIGENHSFDNVFATYTPAPRQTIWNLLARGIVNADGGPGPSFSLAHQMQASDTLTYQLSPSPIAPFATLPQPGIRLGLVLAPGIIAPSLIPDPGIDSASQDLLFIGTETYSTPQHPCTPDPAAPLQCLGENFDTRYPNNLPNGPYQITGPASPFTSYFGDPPHRFYQAWQQLDCCAAGISRLNPSGCRADLYPWVNSTVGTGGNGNPVPSPTFYGGVAMGFYNMAAGDFPVLRRLAQSYAMSDNHHQPVLGGTAVNEQELFSGDMLFYSDGTGNPIAPPPALIDNPDPAPGTNNWYVNDGDAGAGSTGAFTNCSDSAQPGVGAVLAYLNQLPYKPFNDGNCAAGTYYMLNNELPHYTTTGGTTAQSQCPAGIPCILPPSSVPTIGDKLSANGITWRYYSEGFNSANNSFPPDPSGLLYSVVANSLQYSKSIMTTSLRNNLQDLDSFYSDLQNGTLPSVAFVKPDTLLDGHPGTSDPPLFEAFVNKLVDAVQSKRRVWKSAAIVITFDESGGYYDSGYVQPIDYFGDGPRVPLIVVSTFAKPGYVDHTYSDHVSVLKFIEFNWKLTPLSSRSRDNLPNPVAARGARYFPNNSPAIGNLTSLFRF